MKNKKITIRLTKLKELEDAKHPNNIEVGFVKTVDLYKEQFKRPTVGECFHLVYWRTSVVQEVLDDNTFRTYNSIYKWEKL